MRSLIVLLVLIFTGASAEAADLSVLVQDPTGKPVQDAVVTLYPAAGLPSGPINFPWPYEVDQKDRTFRPFVLIVPINGDVTFHNRDPFRHHIYSFSPPKRFELKLFSNEEQRVVRFDTSGTEALGCNIHDSMLGFIKIVDTPFAAKTDAAGLAVLSGTPDGPAKLKVWHPYLKSHDNEIALDVTPAAAGAAPLTVTAEIKPPTPAGHDDMGMN